jgi:hypothetical protein
MTLGHFHRFGDEPALFRPILCGSNVAQLFSDKNFSRLFSNITCALRLASSLLGSQPKKL